jgi:small-conductance mechanosensitive channel
MSKNEVRQLDVEKEFQHLLEEARTIMPGIQALFGFQMIAVFSENFSRRLTSGEEAWHLGAVGLSALAAGLAVFPAALHRRACPDIVSSRLVRYATKALSLAMLPLAVAVSIDFALVARQILNRDGTAVVLAGALFLILMGLWYGAPRLLRQKVATPE